MSIWMQKLIEKKKKELKGTDKWYPDQPEWGTPEATKKARDNTPGQEKMDIVEAMTKAPKWKRAGSNGELEIKFPTGRRFKVEKQLDEYDRHKGEWKLMEYKTGGWVDDWEWIDTYRPKGYAKQKAVQLGQYDKRGKKVADYSHTFQYESTQHPIKEDAMTTADAGIPQDTKNMGPKYKEINVTDRRRRKDKHPVILKRFRKFIESDA